MVLSFWNDASKYSVLTFHILKLHEAQHSQFTCGSTDEDYDTDTWNRQSSVLSNKPCFFITSGKEIAHVFSKWFSFCYCSGGLLVQIQGISILFFQKDLRKLFQQTIADIPPIPSLMDGQFLLLCSLCHKIIFLITQKPKTDWAVEQNDSWRLVSLSTRQKSSLRQSSEWINLRDFSHFVQQ